MVVTVAMVAWTTECLLILHLLLFLLGRRVLEWRWPAMCGWCLGIPTRRRPLARTERHRAKKTVNSCIADRMGPQNIPCATVEVVVRARVFRPPSTNLLSGFSPMAAIAIVAFTSAVLSVSIFEQQTNKSTHFNFKRFHGIEGRMDGQAESTN
jgi:MFS superfamily sulfate permease-like transporter